MRQKITLLIGLCFIIFMAYFFNTRGSNPLEKIDSYRIYYRGINEMILQDMGNYDLVIVEASHFNRQDVQKVKDKNDTIILGYLSVMEIANWDREINGRLDTADYLTINGERQYANNYGNYIGNISHEHYQKILLDVLEKRIMSKGMDGVFLDTIDRLDEYEGDSAVYGRLAAGYEKLLKTIRGRFPHIYILQNRGFLSSIRVSGNYIDGVLWENFNTLTIDNRKSIKNRVGILEKLRLEKGIVIFTISNKNEVANEDFARKKGWKHLQVNERDGYHKW